MAWRLQAPNGETIEGQDKEEVINRATQQMDMNRSEIENMLEETDQTSENQGQQDHGGNEGQSGQSRG